MNVSNLNDYQKEIYQLLVAGHSVVAIADKLDKPKGIIQAQVTRIRNKGYAIPVPEQTPSNPKATKSDVVVKGKGERLTDDDIDVLRSAAEALNLQIVSDGRFNYWGRATKPCRWKITAPDKGYEAGIIDNGDGTYRIESDTYGEIGKIMGRRGNHLMHEFGLQTAERELRRMGYKNVVRERSDRTGKERVRAVAQRGADRGRS